MESMNFETIICKQKNSVATICLNRPTAYNAFTAQMNKDIGKALRKVDQLPDIRSVVITGNDQIFCAGEDVSNIDEQLNHADVLRERYHPMITTMRQLSKPIIAAVNGTAAGAGISLALAADFRLVKPETKFVPAFMNIGLIPDSGFMYFLPRLIGYAKALEISVLKKVISGEEAYQLGLATEVIGTENWEKDVQAFAESLAHLPTKAFSLIKRYMMDGMHLPLSVALEQEAQGQRIAGLSTDHQEGISAFIEKRQPSFSGE